jgi:hypothetical protein
MLYREGNKDEVAWERKRSPVLPPSERTGLASASLTPIGADFTWEMNDFSCGMGRYRWLPSDQAAQSEYAYGDGVVADVMGELSLGASVREAAIMLRNPGGELGATTGWTDSGDVDVSAGVLPNTGSYSIKATFSGNGAGTIFQDIANDAVFRGVSMTWRVYAKKTSGAAVETWSVYIDDGVGTTTGTGVILTSAYQELTVTRTIDGSSTKLNIGVVRTATTAADAVVHFDDFVEVSVSQSPLKKFAVHLTALFAIGDKVLFHWNTTTEVFDPVYYTATTITDMVSFGGYLFLARGSSTAYVYAAAPQTASPAMITSTLATNSNRDQQANFFVKVRDVIWKARNSDTVASVVGSGAGGAINGGAGWTEIVISDTNQNFTNLIPFSDVPIPCKADGFFVFDRSESVASFFDVSTEFLQHASDNNFKVALAWRGWLYMSVLEHAIMRYDGVNFQEVGFLVEYPQFDDFSGKVLAFASDARHLYVMVDTLDADYATTETTFLLSLQEVRIGDSVTWIAHTEHELALGGTTMAMIPFSNNLFVGAARKPTLGTTEGAHCYRIGLPTRGVPSHSRSFDLRHTATFVTPWWDGGYPDLLKAIRTLQIRMPDAVPGDQSVNIKGMIDSDTDWTNITTVTSAGFQTLSIETLAATLKSARRIRFQFTLNAGSAVDTPRAFPTAGPIIRLPIVLHTTPMPQQDDEITMQILVAENLPILTGALETVSPASLLTKLNAYKDSATFPLTLKEDLDRDGTVISRRVVITQVAERRQFDHSVYGHAWVYQLTCVEVPV